MRAQGVPKELPRTAPSLSYQGLVCHRKTWLKSTQQEDGVAPSFTPRHLPSSLDNKYNLFANHSKHKCVCTDFYYCITVHSSASFSHHCPRSFLREATSLSLFETLLKQLPVISKWKFVSTLSSQMSDTHRFMTHFTFEVHVCKNTVWWEVFFRCIDSARRSRTPPVFMYSVESVNRWCTSNVNRISNRRLWFGSNLNVW